MPRRQDGAQARNARRELLVRVGEDGFLALVGACCNQDRSILECTTQVIELGIVEKRATVDEISAHVADRSLDFAFRLRDSADTPVA